MLICVCMAIPDCLEETHFGGISWVDSLESQAEDRLAQLVHEATADKGLSQPTVVQCPPQWSSCSALHHKSDVKCTST